MAGTQGAHNSGEIIIWVGNNYCPKADIFGRQSLAIISLRSCPLPIIPLSIMSLTGRGRYFFSLSSQRSKEARKKVNNAWSQVKRSQPWLFQFLIVLSPGWKYIQWIMQLDSLIIIHWIIIYPADSTIQRLNNWGQPFNLQQQQDQSFSRVLTGPDTGLRNWTQLDPVHNWAVPRLHTYASAILSFKMP